MNVTLDLENLKQLIGDYAESKLEFGMNFHHERSRAEKVVAASNAITRFISKVVKPDPEKWDDIISAGWELDYIDTSEGAFFVRFRTLKAKHVKAEGFSLADALNGIRKNIGIPKR